MRLEPLGGGCDFFICQIKVKLLSELGAVDFSLLKFGKNIPGQFGGGGSGDRWNGRCFLDEQRKYLAGNRAITALEIGGHDDGRACGWHHGVPCIESAHSAVVGKHLPAAL